MSRLRTDLSDGDVVDLYLAELRHRRLAREPSQRSAAPLVFALGTAIIGVAAFLADGTVAVMLSAAAAGGLVSVVSLRWAEKRRRDASIPRPQEVDPESPEVIDVVIDAIANRIFVRRDALLSELHRDEAELIASIDRLDSVLQGLRRRSFKSVDLGDLVQDRTEQVRASLARLESLRQELRQTVVEVRTAVGPLQTACEDALALRAATEGFGEVGEAIAVADEIEARAQRRQVDLSTLQAEASRAEAVLSALALRTEQRHRAEAEVIQATEEARLHLRES